MKKLSVWILLLLLCCSCALAAPFDDDGYLRLVNRDEKITKKYVPADLVKPSVPTNKKSQQEEIYMRKEAALALEEMFAAAKSEASLHLLAVSGYRTYGLQQVMFNNKVSAVGSKEKAWRTVAPAGASEHQLGLAQDVICDTYRSLNKGFADTDAGKWLYQNCYRFGFIVRYLKEWEAVTGYAAEPWHFRYVGVPHAYAVYRLSIPYETYAHAAMELPVYVQERGNPCLLYGLMDDRLNGSGCLFEEICNAACETQAQKETTLAEMTAYFLPEGMAIEDALRGEVP